MFLSRLKRFYFIFEFEFGDFGLDTKPNFYETELKVRNISSSSKSLDFTAIQEWC